MALGTRVRVRIGPGFRGPGQDLQGWSRGRSAAITAITNVRHRPPKSGRRFLPPGRVEKLSTWLCALLLAFAPGQLFAQQQVVLRAARLFDSESGRMLD